MEIQKGVHTLILDTGAIIKNEPSVSSLLNESETLCCVPAVISEIRDSTTRSRVETTLKPFLTLRSPNARSLKFVTDFARRTGDLAVLSTPDLQIIALAYEIECERNNGDWRLRRTPGQKGINGSPPSRVEKEVSRADAGAGESTTTIVSNAMPDADYDGVESQSAATKNLPTRAEESLDSGQRDLPIAGDQPANNAEDDLVNRTSGVKIADAHLKDFGDQSQKIDSGENSSEGLVDSDPASDGWITPSNLRKKQAEDANSSTVQESEQKTMQVAVLTTDFAMQNVILQMNLNLLSPSLTRVKHLKTFVLRCHACFQVTKDLTKQFCPKCGQPSLTRVSCSTSANGEFKLHLKKNMQWNHRGDRYSVPKPVHGSANGRVKGGGKGGWGNDLILAEDQKEYQNAVRDEKKQKVKNLMDEDYLPSILTGDRGRTGGRVRVGAGRNVNSKKR